MPGTTVATGADPDAPLVEAARAGDAEAWRTLVERHTTRVWRIAWRVVRDEADAADVAQEAFMTAWQSIEGFRGEASFSSWMTRIATTRAINFVKLARERVRRASSSLDTPSTAEDADAPAPLEPASREPTPLERLEEGELRARLARCVGELPGEWRAVLALREGEGLAYEDIARALSLALGTVRSRLARARRALAACLRGGPR